MSSSNPQLSLEQAKALVSCLEEGDNDGAQDILQSAAPPLENSDLFAEIGKLTRQLHDSLQNFQLDGRISNLATEEIPDAKERLNYVIEMTEQAANKTMDAVEACLPIAESINSNLGDIAPVWQRLMSRDIKVGEFKELCHNLDAYFKTAEKDSSTLQEMMTEVLMAQGFQDLTGQVIRRVIELVRDVEENLIEMLTMFGTPEGGMQVQSTETDTKKDKKKASNEAEGPIIDKDRDDVVSDQDEVDDLLSSLGF